MAKTSDILAAILAKLDDQDARISALAAPVQNTTVKPDGHGRIPETRESRNARQNTANVSKDVTETIDGVVLRVAASGKGLVLKDVVDSNGNPLWYNATTDLFSNLSAGQAVTLTVGMVTIPARVAVKGPRAGQTIAEHRAMRVVAVSTDTRAPRKASAPITEAAQRVAGYDAVPAATTVDSDVPCPCCGNGCPGFKYSGRDIQFHCSMKQYSKINPDPTLLEWAQWLSSHYVLVYDKKVGTRSVGGIATPPSAPVTPSTGKRGRPAGSKNRKAGSAPKA